MTTSDAAQDAETYARLPYLSDRGVIAYIQRAKTRVTMPPLLLHLLDGRYALVSIQDGRVHVAMQGDLPHCPKNFCLFRDEEPVEESP